MPKNTDGPASDAGSDEGMGSGARRGWTHADETASMLGYDDDGNPRDPMDDPDWCPRCQGSGKVPTMDYESYYGADYKPCPVCGLDLCIGEPPLS